jgi:hypothetical protein
MLKAGTRLARALVYVLLALMAASAHAQTAANAPSITVYQDPG